MQQACDVSVLHCRCWLHVPRLLSTESQAASHDDQASWVCLFTFLSAIDVQMLLPAERLAASYPACKAGALPGCLPLLVAVDIEAVLTLARSQTRRSAGTAIIRPAQHCCVSAASLMYASRQVAYCAMCLSLLSQTALPSQPVEHCCRRRRRRFWTLARPSRAKSWRSVSCSCRRARRSTPSSRPSTRCRRWGPACPEPPPLSVCFTDYACCVLHACTQRLQLLRCQSPVAARLAPCRSTCAAHSALRCITETHYRRSQLPSIATCAVLCSALVFVQFRRTATAAGQLQHTPVSATVFLRPKRSTARSFAHLTG